MAERDQSLERGSTRTQEQQRGLSRRYRDPWGLSLMPGELFSMDPFSTMRRMQQEMDRVFGGFSGSSQEMRAWSPAIEVSERDGNFVVSAELPGLSANNVNVELTDEALVIEGERKQEHTENEGGIRRSERSYGHFYRAIPLPQNIKGDQAKANFKDGVLEVKIPMEQQQQSEQRRRVPIESGPSPRSTGSSKQG